MFSTLISTCQFNDTIFILKFYPHSVSLKNGKFFHAMFSQFSAHFPHPYRECSNYHNTFCLLMIVYQGQIKFIFVLAQLEAHKDANGGNFS